jgi:hypothetical protein
VISFLGMKGLIFLLTVLLLPSASLAQPPKCLEISLPTSGYSFCPPTDWAQRSTRDLLFASSVIKDHMSASLAISEFKYVTWSKDDSFKMFSRVLLEGPRTSRNKLLATSDFKTDSGLLGVKFIIDSTEMYRVKMKGIHYCFDGPDDTKIVFNLTLEPDDTISESVVDRSLRTLHSLH